MKKVIIMLAAAAALLTATSCRKVVGEGPLQTETRNITDFSGVSASIGGKIYYKIDPVYKVEITAQRNILDVIQTTKINGHIILKVKDGVRIKSNEDITVNISGPSADYFHLSGSGDMQVNLSQTLDATISGSGSVYYRGQPLISTHISGSGTVRPL